MSVDRLLLCTCGGSQSVDPATAGTAIAAGDTRVCELLCTNEVAIAEAALEAPGHTVIACGQQTRQFADLAAERGAAERLTLVDIRDRAGWTDAGPAHPKQAALLAEAALPVPAAPALDIVSEGVALVLADAAGGEAALQAAAALAETLAVTVLFPTRPDGLTPTERFDLALGRVRTLTGALGRFETTVDGYAPADPAGRGAVSFAAATDGARSQCDVVVDLTGGAALVSAPHKRDGYVKADPKSPAAVAGAIAEAADLVGSFEKPLYVRFDASLCAHSRAAQPGCTRCLDLCPTGAITSAGDTVAIDPMICAGCGACAAVCPTGAASYDAPPVETLFARLSTMARAFRAAGGTAPRVLFHDDAFGGEMIALSARFGRGLPPDVIPLCVPNVELIGHAELMAALGVGFAAAFVLETPRTDGESLARELGFARAIALGAGQDAAARLAVIAPADPDALEEALWRAAPAPLAAQPVLPLGGRREVTRLAAKALAAQAFAAGEPAAPIPLPERAPYGAIRLDADACTLCLACVSLCPTGALADNPDKPQVRFQEAACVQCGICEATCPENAIALAPQLDLSNAAMSHRVLNEEEPFDCISCGKPFGVRSTIERIVEKLSGKHWMYTGSDNVRLIQMCDDCRVNAQYHSENSPFRMGDRPRVMTTADEIERNKKMN
ncbi:4Fe-4S dicluster domain-containing protein [Acuticoccus sp. I52.16.1]|uniref:4Fe-4S dicluster domain-containing protein n=1 Tax=Acuticoccus sp. I52.16.1 TaxID=2928472 RepID=UPI001FD16559|nr:4Fe-4S dicluster domain-containing protein [Acuticoccus sp. I52.16.1]UOM35271.1 4Fe-4S binding protein [Acuticoccus sp. I52.16.1]